MKDKFWKTVDFHPEKVQYQLIEALDMPDAKLSTVSSPYGVNECMLFL